MKKNCDLFYVFFRRDPTSLVKPPEAEKAREAYSEMVKEKTPAATRHLILVRHGQFVPREADDKQRILTSLGMHCFEQAFCLLSLLWLLVVLCCCDSWHASCCVIHIM